MAKKQYLNKIFVIIILILICVVLYLTLVKNPKVLDTKVPLADNSQVTKGKEINWETLIPEIKVALGPSFAETQTPESQPISILEKADITGDGVDEALIDLGTGGATTDNISLVMIEKNKPIIPLFKDKDGKVSTLIFTSGGGGGGRYGSDVKMLPYENSLYYASYYKYGEKSDYCSVVVYKWNPTTKIFEYDTLSSTKIEKDYCSNINTNL